MDYRICANRDCHKTVPKDKMVMYDNHYFCSEHCRQVYRHKLWLEKGAKAGFNGW